ncbi:hypothetical protein CEXT_84101 [Caerostris extrusa]|uniref:Uncharacterized protein n=1 Tax=Caerostris extrusa TaxID=172846 RepID=A0AAV4NIV4_CAEEX|nr:hypothetical protein CEXT_84101 [Caerostris extrusa]
MATAKSFSPHVVKRNKAIHSHLFQLPKRISELSEKTRSFVLKLKENLKAFLECEVIKLMVLGEDFLDENWVLRYMAGRFSWSIGIVSLSVRTEIVKIRLRLNTFR